MEEAMKNRNFSEKERVYLPMCRQRGNLMLQNCSVFNNTSTSKQGEYTKKRNYLKEKY